MVKNKIILEADTKLEDNELRSAFLSLSRKVDVLNERTKKHTLEIRELKKRIPKGI